MSCAYGHRHAEDNPEIREEEQGVPANPYRTLEVRARAEINEDPDGAFALKLGAKYGGVDVRNSDRPGERRVVVTLHPVKVNTWG